MSREDFVAVAARLFSIYVLFSTIRNIPAAIQMLSQENGTVWAALYALVVLLGLFLCLFLWFFPLTVARKLLPVMKEPRSERMIDASVALSLGLTLLGVWFLAGALIDASYWLALLFRTKQINEPSFTWTHEQIASMVATVVELAISLWLLLGSTGIKRLIYRYRYGKE